MIYLACPYTDPNPGIRLLRFNYACQAAAQLMKEGEVVFSPITHSHHIAPYLPEPLAHDHRFWMEQCLPMVERAEKLFLLPLAGWQLSRGIAVELEAARNLNIPCFTYSPDSIHPAQLSPYMPGFPRSNHASQF